MKKQVLLSLFNQGCTSIFQVLLSLYMIKYWSLEEFGVYSVIFAIGLVVVGLQNALVNTPYSILQPSKLSNIEPSVLEYSLLTINILLTIVVFSFSVLTIFVFTEFPIGMIILIPLYFCSFLFKEFYKNIAIVKEMMSLVAVVEIYGIIIALIFLYALSGSVFQITLAVVLLSIIISNFLVAVVICLKIGSIFNIKNPILCLGVYKLKVWNDSRWSLLGMITTELQNRGYVFIIGLFLGAAEVGLIQAGRVFFGPLNLLTGAWGRIARPRLAVLHQLNDMKKLRYIIWVSLLGFIVFNIFFGCVLFLIWPFLNNTMFENQYDSIWIIVVLWAVATLMLHIRSVFSIAAQSMSKFKSLAFSTLIGASVSLTLTLVLAINNSPNTVVVAIILGELLTTIYILNYTLSAFWKRRYV